jgi:phosphohistidine swiveling domain-containing protein
MKLEKVLEKLDELLSNWRLSRDDWILTGEYAWRLQSYKFQLRKGHLDVFVDREKLPWKVGKLDATAIPPKDSLEFKQLKKFIKQTKFGPHFLPIPIGKVKWQTIKLTRKQSYLYSLPNKRKIRIHKVSEAVKMRTKVFLTAGIEGWSEPKLKRWLHDFIQFKRFAEKKNNKEIVKTSNLAIEKCKEAIEKFGLKPKKEKIPKKFFQVKGRVAYKGKVKGKVKVILEAKRLSKFEQESILVTPMTTPDFVIAIEKAKAIVTDKGGIGCHAAVISREFKIPCIIDTKIATKVLKDGDLIEVNAEDGIVKILRRAK